MINLKALVTGASGFVGAYLMKSLAERQHEVIGISRTTGFVNLQQEEDWRCDILNKDKLKNVLKHFKPDAIFHLAAPAYIPDSYKDPRKTYSIIFDGTLNLLDAVRELDLECKILYVSSADVYGCGNNGIALIESDPFDPINPYSAGKSCAELVCRQFAETYGTNVIIARPFNHTGPGQSIDFVCSNFAYQIAKMSKAGTDNTLFTGNIDVARDFLDVRDVVNAYYELMIRGSAGETYNVCSGKAVSIRHIIELLFSSSTVSPYYIKTDEDKLRSNDISIRVGKNNKLINDTNWKQQYELSTTLAELYQYWREKI